MNRAARREHARRMAAHPKELTEMPRERWPHMPTSVPRVRVFISSELLVQEFEEPEGVMRLSVNRTTVRTDGHWVDGISWDTLQAVKDAVGYADRDAFEIFPAKRDVVNIANIRHLWILPKPIALAWRADGAR